MVRVRRRAQAQLVPVCRLGLGSYLIRAMVRVREPSLNLYLYADFRGERKCVLSLLEHGGAEQLTVLTLTLTLII